MKREALHQANPPRAGFPGKKMEKTIPPGALSLLEWER